MSFKIQIFQSRNFFGITVKLVRGFKEKRKISQIFIIYNFSIEAPNELDGYAKEISALKNLYFE